MASNSNLVSALGRTKIHQLIGEISMLMLHSELHKRYIINDIGAVILPPINLNQFRVYKIKEKPVGFIAWAMLNPELGKKYSQERYSLQLDDWQTGNEVWITDFLAPFGHAKEIINDIKQIYPNTIAHSIRVDAKGQLQKINKWIGKKVVQPSRKVR